MRRETRTRRQIIFDDANYYLYMLAQGSKEWEDMQEAAKIDLELILDCDKIQKHNVDLPELR